MHIYIDMYFFLALIIKCYYIEIHICLLISYQCRDDPCSPLEKFQFYYDTTKDEWMGRVLKFLCLMSSGEVAIMRSNENETCRTPYWKFHLSMNLNLNSSFSMIVKLIHRSIVI